MSTPTNVNRSRLTAGMDWDDWKLAFKTGTKVATNNSTLPGLAGAANAAAIATDPSGSFRQALTMASRTGAWLSDSHNWKRIAYVVGGGAALLIGAQQLAASGSLGAPVASVAAAPKTIARAASRGIVK